MHIIVGYGEVSISDYRNTSPVLARKLSLSITPETDSTNINDAPCMCVLYSAVGFLGYSLLIC